MLETTKKFVEECDELMEFTFTKIDLKNDFIKNVNEEDFKLFKKTMSLYEASKELVIMQAEMIEEQNKKLDKILKLLEKKA